MTRRPKGDALRCSFCNKPQHDVKKLIAGPGIAICDECIGVCNGILAAEEGDAPAPAPETPKRWFVAVLVVEVLIEGSTDGPLVDLQHRLIEAVDAESAYRAALDLGRRVPDLHPSDARSGVRWRFAGLHDLAEVEAQVLAPETEVYSRFAHEPPKKLVVPKRRLTVFRLEAHSRK